MACAEERERGREKEVSGRKYVNMVGSDNA